MLKNQFFNLRLLWAVFGLFLVFQKPALAVTENRGEDSPFGIFGSYNTIMDDRSISRSAINEYLLDLGVKWVQEMHFVSETVPGSINVYSRVGREHNNKPPNFSEEYRSALKAVVQKYKGRIKYWEVDTEPSGFPPPLGWQGHPREYAYLLRETYKTIKSECPDCLVVFGGLPGVGPGFDENRIPARFLNDVLENGGKGYFDVFEFKQHHHNAGDYREIGNKLGVYEKVFARHGMDLKKMPVFIETAMYNGAPGYSWGPLSSLYLPPQTEAQQASALVKTYVFSLSRGIKKIFWNLIIERHNFAGSATNPFNFYGLVHNPQNEGKSFKKLAYFTYKKMVEILDGADWNNIKIIEEGNAVYLYQFVKHGKSIWVAWNDRPDTKNAGINGIKSSKIKITHAVADGNTGLDVKDYNRAFKTEILKVQNEAVSFAVPDVPLFIEEQ